MLLFLFLLSNSFITVIIERNETKTKKNRLTDKSDYYKSSQTKEKTKLNELNQIKTKIH